MILNSFSGGLSYHLRALRHQSLWLPFQKDLRSVLDGISPLRRELRIYGPSAGYNLPDGFLRRFESVSAWDQDILAPWLFARRHRGINIRWKLGRIAFADPRAWVESRSTEPFHFFANMVGQWGGELDTEPLQRAQSHLRRFLVDREFFSFHDLYSSATPFSPGLLGPRSRPLPPHEISLLGDPPAEVIDHLTWNLFEPHLPRVILCWHLLPRRYHLVECVWRTPSAERRID
jgi:hypothetical protein